MFGQCLRRARYFVKDVSSNRAAGQGSSEQKMKAMMLLEVEWFEERGQMGLTHWSNAVAFQSHTLADPFSPEVEAPTEETTE